MNKTSLKSYAIITLACVLYALSFDWFYAPNAFTVGGFTGIAQIINFFVPALSVGLLIIALNLPLYILGLKRFGFRFLFKSLYAMALSSVLIDVLAALHTFSPLEPLLACLYGGVLMGLATGILFREEATTGGTELASWLVKEKVEHISIGKICLALDLTVIVIYAAVFRSLLNALYGGVALYVTTTVLDLVVYGGNTGKLAYIISAREEEITQELLRREMGVTKLSAVGAYTNTERPILLVAVRRREIVATKRLVKELDPDAFFILCEAQEVLGEGFGEYKPNGLT
ncbi:MAG: YitT family protein [Oscillospiraceae bacterium]|nr:YitT family protein [Oscillospiraceae bacterium]